jgi:hypothetical protein
VIEHLAIERFKSILSLALPCRKVNVFIGAPDTGKTNILEALYLLSRLGWGLPLDSALRLSGDVGLEALFYRQFLDRPLRIALRLDRPRPGTPSTEVLFSAGLSGADRSLQVDLPPAGSARVGWGGAWQFGGYLDWIRYYVYSGAQGWQYRTDRPHATSVAAVPYGDNLLYVARHHQRVYDFLKELVAELGWRLRFDQAQKTFRLSEVRADEIVDYNLDLLSDSLKRLFFYGAILLTSEDATLVLDEPDVFAFPPYPKTLGEMIADDASNQFFLTTHNPYFLAAIAEKTPAAHLALFVCFRREDGSTGARRLEESEVARVIELGSSVFFNLDEFVRA